MSATTTKRVLCGNCKGYHASAANVKACYADDGKLAGVTTPKVELDAETAEAFSNIAAGTSPEIRKASYAEVVEPGHYAIQSLTGNNDLDFFRVKAGKGKWEGRVFVDRIVGGHPEIGISRRESAKVLGALYALGAEGREAARLRYAEEIGRCSTCNRSLTDETSRRAGKGPECRKAE